MGTYFTCCTIIIIIILPLIKLGFKKNIKSVSPYKIPNRIIYIYIYFCLALLSREIEAISRQSSTLLHIW